MTIAVVFLISYAIGFACGRYSRVKRRLSRIEQLNRRAIHGDLDASRELLKLLSEGR